MKPSFERSADTGQAVAPPASEPSLEPLQALAPELTKMKKQGLTTEQAFEKHGQHAGGAQGAEPGRLGVADGAAQEGTQDLSEAHAATIRPPKNPLEPLPPRWLWSTKPTPE